MAVCCRVVGIVEKSYVLLQKKILMYRVSQKEMHLKTHSLVGLRIELEA